MRKKLLFFVFFMLCLNLFSMKEVSLLNTAEKRDLKYEEGFQKKIRKNLEKEKEEAITEDVIKAIDKQGKENREEFIDNLSSKSIYEDKYRRFEKKYKNLELFGKSIFNNQNENMSIPSATGVGKDYILGIGDILTVNFSGDIPAGLIPIEFIINSSGSLFIPNVGLVNLSGMSIEKAEKLIIKKASLKYKNIKVDISLLKMREIKVFVLGEVVIPGTYVLTPMSNVVNAIYMANGILDSASIRDIRVIKKDKTYSIDLYDYLLAGKRLSTVPLQDGDTIYIKSSVDKVTIVGPVVRPGIYEIKDNTTIEELIKLAGGESVLASSKSVKIRRVKNEKMQVLVGDKIDKLFPGDFIEIGKIDSRFENGVYLIGNVVRQGVYPLKNGETLAALIEESGGFKKGTYLKKATILRTKSDKSISLINVDFKNLDILLKSEDRVYIYSEKELGMEKYVTIEGQINRPGVHRIYEKSRISDVILSAKGLKKEDIYLKRADVFRINRDGEISVYSVNLKEAIENGGIEDILLKNQDLIKIYKYSEVVEKQKVNIYGSVRKAGAYTYYENMTLKDLLFYAKGFSNGADKTIIEIVRRSGENSGIEREIIDFEKTPNYILKERDQLYIRDLADLQKEENITVMGFVKYPGKYSINGKETLNDIIKRAGGFTEEAFPEAIKLKRKESLAEGFNLIKTDSEIQLTDKELAMGNAYINNINFDKKTEKYDGNVLLKNGDSIYIPERAVAVKIVGEIYLPGMVIYIKGKDTDYYIKSSGGKTESAYGKKVFVIKYNGKTDKNSFFHKVKIEAGDTIVIPRDTREKKDFYKKTLDTLTLIVQAVTVYKLLD